MANPQHLILRRFWLQQKVWGLTETKDVEKMGKNFTGSPPLGEGMFWLQIFISVHISTESLTTKLGEKIRENIEREKWGH